MNRRDRHRVELDRRQILVILAALRSFSDPPTDFDDEFRQTARDLADHVEAETGVEA